MIKNCLLILKKQKESLSIEKPLNARKSHVYAGSVNSTVDGKTTRSPTVFIALTFGWLIVTCSPLEISATISFHQ